MGINAIAVSVSTTDVAIRRICGDDELDRVTHGHSTILPYIVQTLYYYSLAYLEDRKTKTNGKCRRNKILMFILRRGWNMHYRSILFCVLFIAIVALASGFYLHWLAKRLTCPLCPASGACCSRRGFCGSTSEHCGTDEKSDRPSLITKSIFRCAFPSLNDTLLARRFTGLRQSGWLPVNLDEAAVFLSQVSHETDGLKTYEEYCQRTECR